MTDENNRSDGAPNFQNVYLHINWLRAAGFSKRTQTYNNIQYETELLTLMRNKNEFIEYITQQFAKNRFNKPFESFIWAIHFNIPKYQRLPFFDSIIQQSVTYFRARYCFLQETQILGKAYDALGIPTVCGAPDKYFLDTYKRYKSYYPIKNPQYKKTHGNVSGSSAIFYSIEINPVNLEHKQDNLATTFNHQSSSTPITKTTPNFEVMPLLHPVTTITKDDSFIQNTLQNSLFHDENNQILLSPIKSELSGVFDTFKHDFSDEQKIDVTETNNMSNSQSKTYFISRDPKNVMDTNNDASKSDKYGSSSMLSEKSLKRETKHIPHNFNSSKIITPKTNKNLRKKIKSYKTNFDLKHLKRSSKTRKTCNMQKLKRVKQETTSHSKLNNNKLLERIEHICSDSSFSDLKTSQIPITKQFRTNETEHNSIMLELNDSREENIIKNLSTDHMDIEYQSTKNKKNLSSSVNFFFINNSINYKELDTYVPNNTFHVSSFTFSDNDVLQPNLTGDIHQLESVSLEFTKWSNDSSVENNDEQSTTHNILTEIFNNNSFEDTSSL